MSYPILKASTQSPLLFFLTLASDHVSPATGLSPTVTISKNGGAFASPSGAVSEIANGWYQVAANATDTGTAGPLALHAVAATADNFDGLVAHIVGYDPQNALATPTNITAGTITTTTNLTNAPTAGDFTATMKTSIGTAVAGSAVASVTGNVTGSVGSIAGVTFPANFSVLGISVAGIASADIKKVNAVTVNGDGSATPWGP